MRKFALAVLGLALAMGVTLAAPVTLVKFDEKTKEVTVKARTKKGEPPADEKTVKLSSDVKFYDGDKEITYDEAVKKMTGEKAVKGFDLTMSESDKAKVESVKFMPAKGKGGKPGEKKGEKKGEKTIE